MSIPEIYVNTRSTIEVLDSFSPDTVVVIKDSLEKGEDYKLLLEVLKKNYRKNKIAIFSKPIVDALKMVSPEGNIVDNLDREKYLQLQMPLECEVIFLNKFFNSFKFWDLHSFIAFHEDHLRIVAL